MLLLRRYNKMQSSTNNEFSTNVRILFPYEDGYINSFFYLIRKFVLIRYSLIYRSPWVFVIIECPSTIMFGALFYVYVVEWGVAFLGLKMPAWII